MKIKFNKTTKILLIIVCGLITAFITFFLNSSYIAKNTQFKNVVVASQTVGPFEEVKNYEIVKKVISSIPNDSITDINSLNNKKFYTGKLGIGAGDIIRTSRITDAANNPYGKIMELKKNKVLVGVNSDLVRSAGKNLKPGTLVHGMVFIKGNDRNTFDRVISPQNDPLLANLLVKEVQNSDASELGEKGREAIPSVVILEVSIPVAQKLVFYQEIGKIYLTPTAIDKDTVLFTNVTK